MDKTYAESIGHQSFDWNKAIDEMIKLSKITTDPDRAAYLYTKSRQWVSCACGNQCAIIPRTLFGRPMDDILEELGIAFMQSIERWEWKIAASILGDIEERAAYLIKIELTKLNQTLVNEKP